jgi:hypothetical protein
MGTIGYYRTAGYYGYCIVPTGTAVVLTGTTVLQTGYCATGTIYLVPKMGYYRVLQTYAAEGMSRVRIRLRLRVCTHPARYLTFLRVISIKMASAFAEGVIISVTISEMWIKQIQ